ncbi:MAG: dihydropteroate synthase [Alphaproteobacteria bacterium]
MDFRFQSSEFRIPTLFGIVNITDDSFSDGGLYLAPDAAIAHARKLSGEGADVLDLGAVSSNPDSKQVPYEVEIARLGPVVAALKKDGSRISIDTFAPETQIWAAGQGVDYLNDIQGFPEEEIYPELARAKCRLVVMHSVQGRGPAARAPGDASTIMDRISEFFQTRIAALTKAGIARERLIIDPGMGLFLGAGVEVSLTVLRRLPELKEAFGLPLLVSVSRKSFLRKLTGRDASASGPATLAAELFAAAQGADFIRTHEPAPLRDALTVAEALRG